jgi:hypothetical protein
MMKKQTKFGTFRSIWILLLVILTATVASGQYELSWYTIDGGGGQSSGGDFSVTATIAQPDAAWSTGGEYELLGGFWPGGPLCFVDFEDFARFAERWRDNPCNVGNNFCGGADLNRLDGVDFEDVKMFVDQWLCYCPAEWPLK